MFIRASRGALSRSRQYADTGKSAYLRDGVAELEDLVRRSEEPMTPAPTPGRCREEGDRLERALRSALPPSAFAFLASKVQLVIDVRLREMRPRLKAHLDQPRLSRASWCERAELEWDAGAWFVDWFQQLYDEEMELERHEEEAQRHKQEEAEERFQDWQAARDKDRLKESPAEESQRRGSSWQSTRNPDCTPLAPPPPTTKASAKGVHLRQIRTKAAKTGQKRTQDELALRVIPKME